MTVEGDGGQECDLRGAAAAIWQPAVGQVAVPPAPAARRRFWV